MNCIFLIMADDSPSEEAYTAFKNIFYDKRLEKSAAFPEIKHRLSLLGELTARAVLSESRGADIADLRRVEAEHGKPFFENFKDFYFNISHSASCVAVAIAENDVGIDIEKLREPNFAVAERFNINEKTYIFQNPTDSVKRFYEIWTKKEAFSKQKGTGISVALSAFDVTETKHSAYFKSFTEENFQISVYSEAKGQKFSLIKLTETELLNLISQNRLIKTVEN